MDQREREKLVRRISGKCLRTSITYKYQEIPITVRDPNLDILIEADWVYDKAYKDNRDQTDIMTLEESYEELISKGLWSYEKEAELKQIREDIKTLSLKLNQIQFIKNEIKVVKSAIDRGKKRAEELHRVKTQLWTSTLEYLCTRIQRHFILRHTTEVFEKQLLDDPGFLDALSVYYFDHNDINEASLRELARTDPWRLYWISSKNTGTSLFPHSSVEMSDYQYALVSWSKVYDYAYESQNRPDDSVIDDDDRFDAWYQSEIKRMQDEQKKHAIEMKTGRPLTGIGGQEIFIPADIDGAKDVYNMNSPEAKMRIASRQEALKKSGQLREHELPDVNSDLKMEANRAGMQGAINRSKQ